MLSVIVPRERVCNVVIDVHCQESEAEFRAAVAHCMAQRFFKVTNRFVGVFHNLSDGAFKIAFPPLSMTA
jgi:hypothetical protein